MNKTQSFLSYLFIVSALLFCVACSKGEEDAAQEKGTAIETTTNNSPMAEEPVASNEPEGLKLMKASDCFTCHQQDVTIVGPSFKTIKEKYPLTDANAKNLTDKVIKGGTGVWGQVAMPSHPNLDKADAERMVRYILSL